MWGGHPMKVCLMCVHSTQTLRDLAALPHPWSSQFRHYIGQGWAWKGALNFPAYPTPTLWHIGTPSHTCPPISLGSPVYQTTVSCSLGHWGPTLAWVLKELLCGFLMDPRNFTFHCKEFNRKHGSLFDFYNNSQIVCSIPVI